ncbi:MAG: TIGR02594 family protein [Acidobacteriota bacterium]
MKKHTVQSGETLSGIARDYGISMGDLLAANSGITNPGRILVGQEINIPGQEVKQADPPWLAVARLELGVHEVAGAADNPRIIEYHQATTLKATDDEVAWCSAFANWCMDRAGLRGTKNASARSWLVWGQAIEKPQRGCITVLSRGNNSWQGHVCFFLEDLGARIRVLGGNQGDAVTIAEYSKDRVLGYRWLAA